jgi:Tfp pilus assembly protein PilX
MKTVSIALLVLLLLGAVAVLLLHLVHRSRGGTPEQVEAKAALRHAKAQLAKLEKEQRGRVRAAARTLKQAQREFDRAVKLADAEVKRLADPRGAQLASYRGVVVYERWIVTPHGQGPIAGTTASVDAQVYLSIDSPALASVV